MGASYSQQVATLYFEKKPIPVEEGTRNLDAISGKKILIKIGGDSLNNGGYDEIGKSIAELYGLGIIPTIVHGAGSQIDRIMEGRGLPIEKANGLRAVPDEKTLNAVVDGLREVNEGLVSAINKYSLDSAVGLTSEKIVYAKRIPVIVDKGNGEPVDPGYVGEVRGINRNNLYSCIEQEKIPVLWCIGHEGEQQLNVNADWVAKAIVEQDYSKFILLTSVGGYKERGKIVPEMTLEELKNHSASGGMGLKLDAIIQLLEEMKVSGKKSLKSVQISSPENLIYELLTDKGRGTMIKLY
ncbi:acetylglutamate kinase [Candidatus Woesearchaeota archaeon]|nr:acetylglutamate kinase [Candidatus Woesearchaeota archaeon]